MTPPIQPGTVKSLSPFRVHMEGDPEGGLPCQQVGPAAVDQVGAVFVAEGQRVWLGEYGQDGAPDLGPLTSRVTNLEATVNTGANRNSLLRSDLNALTSRVSTLETKVAALEADTGWVSLVHYVGWDSVAGFPLRVRKVNGWVTIEGLANLVGTNATARITHLTADFRPVGGIIEASATTASGNSAICVPRISTGGDVTLNPSRWTATPSGYVGVYATYYAGT